MEPDRLRFDFTHFSAMTVEELQQVEVMVNDAILEGYPIRTDVLPIEEAKKREMCIRDRRSTARPHRPWKRESPPR